MGRKEKKMKLYFVLLMKSHLQSYPCPLQINSFWNLGFLLGIRRRNQKEMKHKSCNFFDFFQGLKPTAHDYIIISFSLAVTPLGITTD